jgi:hypothetical protein
VLEIRSPTKVRPPLGRRVVGQGEDKKKVDTDKGSCRRSCEASECWPAAQVGGGMYTYRVADPKPEDEQRL